MKIKIDKKSVIPKSKVDYKKSFESRNIRLSFSIFSNSWKIHFQILLLIPSRLKSSSNYWCLFFPLFFELLKYQIQPNILEYFSASMKIRNRQKNLWFQNRKVEKLPQVRLCFFFNFRFFPIISKLTFKFYFPTEVD